MEFPAALVLYGSTRLPSDPALIPTVMLAVPYGSSAFQPPGLCPTVSHPALGISQRDPLVYGVGDFSLPGTSGVQPCKVMMTLFILRCLLLVKDTQSTKVHEVKLSFPSTPLCTPR